MPQLAGHVDAGLDAEGVPCFEGEGVALDDVGVLVLLEADPVTGAMDEVLAVPASAMTARVTRSTS